MRYTILVVFALLLVLLPCSSFAAGGGVTLTVGLFAGRAITACTVTGTEPLQVRCAEAAGEPRTVSSVKLQAAGDQVQAEGVTAPQVTISSSAPLQVNPGRGRPRSYRGSLLVIAKRGRLTLINQIDLEDYLRGSVPGEMPAGFAPEALKAQAIASRTYALATRGKHRASGYDLCDGVHCQVYLGVQAENPHVDEAVAETAGLIVTYEGKPIQAVYCDNCGGETASSADVWGTDPEPYLCAVKDTSEDGILCADAPHATWTRQLPLEGVVKALAGFDVQGPITAVTPQTDPGELRPKAYQFTGAESGQTWTINAAQVREAVNRALGSDALPSADFTATIDGAVVTFHGRGDGHGVGMCQWGANALAKAGYTAAQILQHYYPGTTVEQMDRAQGLAIASP